MSYELKKPYTDIEKADFIVQYNHNKGLRIEDTEQALYALEANEMMAWREVEETITVEVEPAVYEDVEVFDTQQILVVDKNGEPILDESGNLQYTEEKILIPAREYDVYETDENGMTVFDEDGNPIVKEQVVEPEHYKSHIETVLVKEAVTEEQIVTVMRYVPVINPDYEAEQAEKERQRIASLKVTKRVFALALQQYGITYAQLKDLIATNDQAQLEWDLCIELERSNPLLDVMAGQLGVTPEQLDYIFRVANGEEVEPPVIDDLPAEDQESEAVGGDVFTSPDIIESKMENTTNE